MKLLRIKVYKDDENNAKTLSIIVAFLSTLGTILSIIGPLSGNLRIALLAKILAQMPIYDPGALAHVVL